MLVVRDEGLMTVQSLLKVMRGTLQCTFKAQTCTENRTGLGLRGVAALIPCTPVRDSIQVQKKLRAAPRCCVSDRMPLCEASTFILYMFIDKANATRKFLQ